MTTDKIKALTLFTTEELKAELQRRKAVERAKNHLPSAEASLARAQAKVKAYRDSLKEEEAYAKRRS